MRQFTYIFVALLVICLQFTLFANLAGRNRMRIEILETEIAQLQREAVANHNMHTAMGEYVTSLGRRIGIDVEKPRVENK